MNTKWIKCSDRLPVEDEWVLVHLNDYAPFLFSVARIRIGISNLEREKMKRGDLPDKDVESYGADGLNTTKRSLCIYPSDQDGNNALAYSWNISGGQGLFGHHVDYWMPLPEFNQPAYNILPKSNPVKFVEDEEAGKRLGKILNSSSDKILSDFIRLHAFKEAKQMAEKS